MAIFDNFVFHKYVDMKRDCTITIRLNRDYGISHLRDLT